MCSIVRAEQDVLSEVGGLGAEQAESLEALESEICSLAAHLAAATCRWLSLVAEFDAREGWAEWGVTSCAHWLSWRCGIGITAGREHVRVGRVLRGLPLVKAAFASGELSYSKVRALTRVASEQTEAELVELARHATGAQLERLCRQYGSVLRATSEHGESLHERQQLSTYWDDDGMLVVQGRLTPEDGAALLAALDRARESVPEATYELGAAAVRAQSLVALATGGESRAEVVVHVDVETLATDEIRGQSEVANGPAVAPETDSAAGLRRGRCHDGRARGWAAVGWTTHPCDSTGVEESTAQPGSRLPFPGMHPHRASACASHRTLGTWRADGPGQLGAALLVPPSAGARGRVPRGGQVRHRA